MIQDFKKIKKLNISETIVDQIKDMILSGKLKVGDKLPSERELTELLDVSRSSVREAMRSLHSMGIVDIRSGEGTYLNDNTNILSDHFKLQNLLNRFSRLELIEARQMLELEIIKLATLRGTKEEFNYLEEMYHETLKYENNLQEFIKADFNFHLAIAEVANNKYLAEMLNTTKELLMEVNLEVMKIPGHFLVVKESHKRIIEAISSGSVKKSQKEMRMHIDMINENINKLNNRKT